jgi:alkanesulfonate monooxygenase SsuD/methylene tetrahydromethanopterin reductase-like flavin-dependent oxidoreductase (luciferase family)
MAPSSSVAEQRVRLGYERMYELYRQWGQSGEPFTGRFEQLKEERLIAGSLEQVADQIMAYQHEFGVDFMWFTVYWPGMDLEWTLETIELFGERVIPDMKGATPGHSMSVPALRG